MTTRTRRVTKRQAEAVLSAVKRQFAPWVFDGDGPVLTMEFDWIASMAPHPAIVWQGGPPDWPQYAGGGGIDEEFGFNIKPLAYPATVFCEPATSWALSIFPADAR